MKHQSGKGSKTKRKGNQIENEHQFPNATTSKKAKQENLIDNSAKIPDNTGSPEGRLIEALKFVQRESRRCQVCSKTYDKVEEALQCIKSHKKKSEKNSCLRCYLCFNIFPDTTSLFEHYTGEHRHANEISDVLLCSCCDKKVPYKNVSVHVIALHANQKIPEKCNPKINSIENLEENYKNEGWRYDEAKKCHGCSKKFLIIPAALDCLKQHRLLQCYFCFSTFERTHLLFDHYKSSHKQVGKKNSVICEFCGESVTFRSAVNHVINCHLSKVI